VHLPLHSPSKLHSATRIKSSIAFPVEVLVRQAAASKGCSYRRRADPDGISEAGRHGFRSAFPPWLSLRVAHALVPVSQTATETVGDLCAACELLVARFRSMRVVRMTSHRQLVEGSASRFKVTLRERSA
jgi:hypothetical protein